MSDVAVQLLSGGCYTAQSSVIICQAAPPTLRMLNSTKHFTEFDFVGDTADFLDLASNLGDPIRSRSTGTLVDRLAPVQSHEARPRSLSNKYGLGAFPFHTDAAYSRTPPKFVLLRLVSGDSVRPTSLISLDEDMFTPSEWESLRRDVWVVNGGRGRFYANILSRAPKGHSDMFRYDRDCMRPALDSFSQSRLALERVIRESKPIDIEWRQGRVLMINNWTTLHARPEVANRREVNRVLERIVLN